MHPTRRSILVGLASSLSVVALASSALSAPREVVSAPRTYYVRSDGNDANNGLANTSAGAFRTIQHAVDVASLSLDLQNFDVTIKVTCSQSGATIARPWVGQGSIIIEGDVSNPSSVLLTSATDGIVMDGPNPAPLKVRGVKFQASRNGISALNGGYIQFDNVEFGACGFIHISAAARGSFIERAGPYRVSGGALVHWHSNANSVLAMTGSGPITFVGSPHFAYFFAGCAENAAIYCGGNTYVGNATGMRCMVHNLGIIQTNGAGQSAIPGSAPGIVDTATGGYVV